MPRGEDRRLAYEARHGINKKEARSQEPEVRMKWQSVFWNKSQPLSVSHRWWTGYGASRRTRGKEDTGESRQYLTFPINDAGLGKDGYGSN